MDKKTLKGLADFIDPYRVTNGSRFRLKDIDPDDTRGLKDEHKPEAQKRLAEGVAWLADEQDKLYAQDRRLAAARLPGHGRGRQGRHDQARDERRESPGQPGHVVQAAVGGGTGPRLDVAQQEGALPERGRIGIFNRSYYEEVLVVRVHESILATQKLPKPALTKGIFRERLRDIAHFEDYLTRNGTTVVKFFLHVSRKEQKNRFMERLDEPEKNWKFSHYHCVSEN